MKLLLEELAPQQKIERFRFAPTAYNSNPNMAEIPTLLGGGDIGATKLWWVRSNRPKQPNQ